MRIFAHVDVSFRMSFVMPHYHKIFIFAVLEKWLIYKIDCSFVNALHGMQTRSSDENSVWPSVRLTVRPSVTRVDCDKTVERYVQIYILYERYERSFSLLFWEEEWLVGGDPFNLKFGSTGPRCSKIADFEPIIARNASSVTPSEKVQLTLIGSPLRAFQWA